MDVGKSFTYMFEDKEWITKLAIGGVILLAGSILSILVIPILAAVALLLGYTLVVIRNVYDGNPTPLPKWDNIGDLFVKGVLAMVGVIIWSIPLIILACCISIAMAALTNGNADGGRALSGAAGLVVACLYCLMFVVGIVISLFVYAPLTLFALTNQINSFWDFQGISKFIQANFGNYFIAFLLALVANFIAGFGIIACLVGVFFTTFWGMLVIGHLFGQVARTNLAPPDTTILPPTPPMDEPPGTIQGTLGTAPTA